MSEDAGLTALEALGLAIRGEKDARDVYRELAERCERPAVRRRFELLAADEEWHREFLEDKWRELSGGVELKLPPSRLPPDMTTRSERCARSVLEVVDMAIGEERRSQQFYLRAARETEDLSGRSMFRFLADMERRHVMDLQRERQLLARYPNYGRPGPQPWRVEASLVSGERKKGAP